MGASAVDDEPWASNAPHTSGGPTIAEPVEAVPGLFFIADFVAPAESDALLDFLAACDRWKSMGTGRRVLHFGHMFDYATESVVPIPDPDCPDDVFMPAALAPVVASINALVTPDGSPLPGGPQAYDQVIVNGYEKSQGIHPHIDRTHCFGPVIAALSLGDDAVLTFLRDTQDGRVVYDVPVPARSLYIMTGDARYAWRHGLDARTNAAVRTGVERVSITWRTVVDSETAAAVTPSANSLPGVIIDALRPETDLVIEGELVGRVVGRRGATVRALSGRLGSQLVVGTLAGDPSVGLVRILDRGTTSLEALQTELDAILDPFRSSGAAAED
ncbi:2OG-Fe(II) oxygenase [Thecamonas trahens ATCC 50062]|uniref:2OG-Fe(II) oxygenase n=1 Tax=Thecamonas trahens ATCC 50062 TaxID=461836 RepID=A0A0L0DMP0_THETB|nr:2OG-Fe(II) oxygenase [Thecamonas trahens ATCC 50062]KNC52673.1 2OG-Fe(II) oxygenase [Thecamonas trahens ATCC 50062]|eukprot:XP_013755222.1 2OG-Fe(II) oxygenase [Thecamonas trahens ATCC 50062]